MATKGIPHSTYVDPIQSSIRNDQIVVAKRKVTKCIDRSLPHEKTGEKRAKLSMKVEKKKTKEGNFVTT